MARPTKQGVDYFPLDVHLDDKFKFVEIKYKLEGFSIIIKLLQRIYSNSYWCKWSDDESLLFSDEHKADVNLVRNVVTECVDREIFDKELYYKYAVLTSKGIQKRYKEIVRRRKDVEVTTEYLLVDNNFGVNDVINLINDGIEQTTCQHSDNKSTQSKVNKSKVNKTKINDTKVNDISEASSQKFKPPTIDEIKIYCLERNNNVDPEKFIDHYTANGWVRGKTKIKDWKACVRTWEKNNKKESSNNPFS